MIKEEKADYPWAPSEEPAMFRAFQFGSSLEFPKESKQSMKPDALVFNLYFIPCAKILRPVPDYSSGQHLEGLFAPPSLRRKRV